MKLSAITTYKIISIICCVVLSAVQTFLIYNTYKLESENYFVAEKSVLNQAYSLSISNDKIFPGGQAIIDRYIYSNINELARANKKGKAQFDALSNKICDTLFAELKARQNLDSLIPAIIKNKKLNNNLDYVATLNSLELAFEVNQYIPMFLGHAGKDGKPAFPEVIAGSLTSFSKQTLVTGLTVSTPIANSYRIGFSLYMDTNNRRMGIFKEMLPTLLLSIAAIISVVVLFYITFRNWVKQKKIADVQSDFVNNITHEFHTPLAAIIVANKNIQLEKIIEDKEKIKPLTEVIKRQSERLQHLINQVIDVAKINHQQLKLQETSLHNSLSNIILDYQLKFTDDSARIEFQANAVNDTVMLDNFWFTTMLTNLMDNAIKYNINEQKLIVIKTSNEGENVVLTIEDNGVGMKKEMLNNIFDKFYRAPDENLPRAEGLGLGLFYVRAGIDAHGWRIDVQSQQGKGTRFAIMIIK